MTAQVGLGGLCFERPEDIGKLEKRRHVTVFTSELGPLLRDHRIPLVFLEACQTAQAEKASESVASELLKVGVASVVAMSHSVLVETARRFVEAFYEALAAGKRVGDAMLAGQRQLKDDTFRGRIFGAGELRLEDWFVPVLFQEKDDPQLFRTTPAQQTQEDFADRARRPPRRTAAGAGDRLHRPQPRTARAPAAAAARALRRGARPGRRRQDRARRRVRPLDGPLAADAPRRVRLRRDAQQRRRGARCPRPPARGDGLLRRHVRRSGKSHPARRARAGRAGDAAGGGQHGEHPAAALRSKRRRRSPRRRGRELDAILALCARLNAKGDTRLVFTSREALPAPFDAERHRRELHQLDREDAVKLVERVLNASAGGDAGAAADAAREAIEQLVDAVHGHARTLALLAPALRSRGVEATRDVARRADGGDGETVPRQPRAIGLRQRRAFPAPHVAGEPGPGARARRCFTAGSIWTCSAMMMQWEEADVASLAVELIETGLATPNRYNHLTLNPALCPYLRGRMDAAEREALTARWVEAMRAYVEFLEQQQSQNAEVAATLTVLELPNLFALLDLVQRAGDAEATIDLATSLYSLLQALGKPRLLERVGQVRDAAAAALGDAWNHARFEAARTRIEQQLAGGRLREAFEGAQQLLQRARAAGEQAYPGADYDLAMACFAPGPRVEDGRRHRNRPCRCWTRPASASRPSRRRVPTKARKGWRPSASRNEATVFATWAGSTKRRRPTKRASAAPSNSVTTGRSPSAKASLGPSACTSAATRRRWRRMPKRASGSRSWTNRAPSP